MCYAAELVIVEVTGRIVPVGAIPPGHVDVPGIVVDILVRGKEARNDG
jgi:acyl CoA:acetate/3-ketoacid CoA transferase alpha subunit